MRLRKIFVEGYKAGYKKAINEAHLSNEAKRIAAGNLPKQKLYWMASCCWELHPALIKFCSYNELNPDDELIINYLYELNNASHSARRLADSLENYAPKLVSVGQIILSSLKKMFKEINTASLSVNRKKVRNYAKQALDALDKIIDDYNLIPLIKEMEDEGTAYTFGSMEANRDFISGKDSWSTRI